MNKLLIRLAIIVVVILFALINCRMLSFEHGISKCEIPDGKKSITEIINIEKVEYYKSAVRYYDDKPYNIYLKTNDGAYLINGTEKDVQTLQNMGKFSKKYTPRKIGYIPIYVEILLAGVILLFPYRTKNEAE